MLNHTRLGPIWKIHFAIPVHNIQIHDSIRIETAKLTMSSIFSSALSSAQYVFTIILYYNILNVF